ncbi:MAG: exodeoxyribonuclease III [Spartobacteria bacterium]|nr:exodeoxyribonuclease III [Spartobacteria bacterium]
MKIATFNANSIRSRLPIILDWINKNAPDALCVQETKAQDHDFPDAEIRQAGLHVVFKGEKSYNGVAIISPHAVKDAVFGFDDDGPSDETRLVAATIQGVHILNAYVPQGRALDHPMWPYKLQWFKRLRAYLDRHFKATQGVVWTGDLNVAHLPLDVNHPENKARHVCYHADVRQAFSDCLAWGFTDVFREKHPDERLYSFFDYRVKNALENNVGWRIDYILATPALAACCTDAYIDLAPRRMEKPSDHTFLVAEFDRRAAP